MFKRKHKKCKNIKTWDGYIRVRIYPENPFFVMTDHLGYVCEQGNGDHQKLHSKLKRERYQLL